MGWSGRLVELTWNDPVVFKLTLIWKPEIFCYFQMNIYVRYAWIMCWLRLWFPEGNLIQYMEPHIENLHSIECKSCFVIRVATGQGKVRDIQGQRKVRQVWKKSVKFQILKKVRGIYHWSGKFWYFGKCFIHTLDPRPIVGSIIQFLYH